MTNESPRYKVVESKQGGFAVLDTKRVIHVALRNDRASAVRYCEEANNR